MFGDTYISKLDFPLTSLLEETLVGFPPLLNCPEHDGCKLLKCVFIFPSVLGRVSIGQHLCTCLTNVCGSKVVLTAEQEVYIQTLSTFCLCFIRAVNDSRLEPFHHSLRRLTCHRCVHYRQRHVLSECL